MYRENSDDVQRHPLSFQQSTNYHMLVNYPRLRKQVSKMIRRNSLWCSYRAGNSACTYKQDWKTLNSCGTGQSTQENLASLVSSD